MTGWLKKFLLIETLVLTCWVTPVLASEEVGGEDITGLIKEYQGTLEELLGSLDESTAGEAFSFIEEKMADGSFEDEAGLKEAIIEGKEKFGIEISEEQAKEVLGLVTTLEEMGFSGEAVLNNIESMYNEYGNDFVNHSQEMVADVVKESMGSIITNAIWDFFRMIGEAIKSFFTNLF